MRIGFALVALTALAATTLASPHEPYRFAVKRGEKTFNVDLMKKLFASPEWTNLFKSKSPADKAAAEDASLQAAQNADSAAANLSNDEAQKQATDSYNMIKSKLTLIKPAN